MIDIENTYSCCVCYDTEEYFKMQTVCKQQYNIKVSFSSGKGSFWYIDVKHTNE